MVTDCVIDYICDGIKDLEVVKKKMQEASNHWTTGMHFSNAEVNQLLGSLMMAQNRFRDNIAVVDPEWEEPSSDEQ